MNLVRSGFRTVRENPALIFAEIAWRWAFGAAAWILVILTVRTILEGIDVSAAEVAVARSNDAYLIADAIVRILVQVLPRLAHAMLVVVPALSVFWVATATIGRAATLHALFPAVILSEAEVKPSERFSREQPRPSRRTSTLSLISVNVLRTIFTLATLLAYFGTVLLVSAQFTPDLAPALLLAWLCLAFFVGCLWGIVNWFLALAPIFIVREGFGVGKAISASLGLYRDARREYMAIASWFGLFRGAALLFAIAAGSVVVAAGSVRLALAWSIVVALAYFAFADYLYIARLAAFVALAAAGDHPAEVRIQPVTPPPASSTENQDLKLETET
jgi:hypothetical protein